MKPHVTCHMLSSVDGRILGRRWRPKDSGVGGLFEQLHDQLGCDAWIVGRVTGQEFAKGRPYPEAAEPPPNRDNHFVRRDAPAYGVVLDAHAKIAWGRADIGGDPIVVVLTRAAPDAHLAGLRADGVSYLFAGETQIDLSLTLETLNRDLGVERVLLEGGGVANGAFLRAGLVDELSLVVCPAVDGAQGAPCIFDSDDPDAGRRRCARCGWRAAPCSTAGRCGCATVLSASEAVEAEIEGAHVRRLAEGPRAFKAWFFPFVRWEWWELGWHCVWTSARTRPNGNAFTLNAAD